MMLVALLIVVAQGIICCLLIAFIRTFGELTKAMVRVHDSNRVITDQHVEIIQLLSRHPVTEDHSHAETDAQAL